MSRHQVKRSRKPRLLSLCSGIGGIDLSWEMAGGEIAGQCELDGYCQQVLARHWPDVQRVADIRHVWGDSFHGPIDLIAGGVPCQPFSVAGQRRGQFDPRHLWPEMRRIVDIYQPAFVLVENVAGFVSMALDDVLTDLDASGYEAGAVVLPAAAVGAPHQRERVFIVAHAQCLRREWRQSGATGNDEYACECAGQETAVELEAASTRSGAVLANADRQRQRQPQGCVANIGRWADDSGEDVADSTGARLPLTRRSSGATRDAQAGARLESEPERRGAVEYASGAGCQKRDVSRVAGDAGHTARRSAQGGRTRQTQSALGRELDGLPRRLDGDRRDASDAYPYQPWPAGPGESQYAWEAPRVTQERIPNRAARLKALGNAVVPAQVYPILAAIIQQWHMEQAQCTTRERRGRTHADLSRDLPRLWGDDAAERARRPLRGLPGMRVLRVGASVGG